MGSLIAARWLAHGRIHCLEGRANSGHGFRSKRGLFKHRDGCLRSYRKMLCWRNRTGDPRTRRWPMIATSVPVSRPSAVPLLKCKAPSYRSDCHILYMSGWRRHRIVKLRAGEIGSTTNREAHHRSRDIVLASFEPDSNCKFTQSCSSNRQWLVFLRPSAARHCDSVVQMFFFYSGSETTSHAGFDLRILCAPGDADEKRARRC